MSENSENCITNEVAACLLSKTQIYLVYYHRKAVKSANIHILEGEPFLSIFLCLK